MRSLLGIKLGKSWEAYVIELSKKHMYITPLEFEGLTRTQQPQDRILRALYDGPNGLKWKDFGDRGNSVVYHQALVRKDEESADFAFIIAEIQTRLCLQTEVKFVIDFDMNASVK